MEEQWYIPISIIPGIALLLTSTAHMTLGLTKELNARLKDHLNNEMIIEEKLKQIKKLSAASVLLYSSLGVLIATVLFRGINMCTEFIGDAGIFISISLFFIAILIMVLYSIKAYTIRQKQFQEIISKS